VFSRENVQMPEVCASPTDMDGSLNCHGYGSSVTVTAAFGMCAAGWVLDQLAKGALKTRYN
jgi:tRNA A37 threonylcarbamoyladenosine dehydratase